MKKLKNLESIVASTDAYIERKNKLGETFGTKKAKAAIRAQERNRIDVDAMKGTASHIQDTIGENTTNLPTQGEQICLDWMLTSLIDVFSIIQRKQKRQQMRTGSSRRMTRMLNDLTMYTHCTTSSRRWSSTPSL